MSIKIRSDDDMCVNSIDRKLRLILRRKIVRHEERKIKQNEEK